ncbi:hypothetical protein H4R18_000289 [Coemansia javaensis]|uniref:type I protein arginine methyltransferase n=1 Tax=Coemansia javaensis TaxID=2761396 RepID=A0A9W8HQ58_9FUNG|nr:hypothetical protein H4R18_000289 [Coemansia javaensis]
MSAASCTGSESDGSQDDRWDDWEGDEMDAPMKCLFCAELFRQPAALFRHASAAHAFDFPAIRSALGLDFYQSMRAVNYIRARVLAEPGFGAAAGLAIDGSESFLSDDAFLKPVIPDDSLLYALDDLDLGDPDAEDQHRHPEPQRGPGSGGSDAPGEREMAARVRLLEQQLEQRDREMAALAAQFEDYKQLVKRQFYDSASDAAGAEPEARGDGSDYYFDSYAGNDIHMQMLQDKVRTDGYRDFMYDNKDLFKGKVVLDVGCGTGILSMFAARAGAAKVVAVDNSDIIHRAQANVIENGLGDVVVLVRGKIEELELPVDRVDIIVSEWMGYFLLFEAMLDSVLVARDRYLAPGGLLAPSASYIYLTAISDEAYMSDKVRYWDSVYGFKMSAMRPPEGEAKEADVDVVPAESVAASRALLAEIDHGSATPAVLDFSSPFALRIARDADIHALLGYFDVAFSRSQAAPGPGREELCLPVHDDGGDVAARALWRQPASRMGGFTTGPHGTPTHWKQTIFVLRAPIAAKQGDELRGTFACRKSATNPRELDLEITYCHIPAGAAAAAAGPSVCEKYRLR